MRRFIPTPSISEFSAGPFTVHFYALCIIIGIVVAIWIGDLRYRKAGGGKNVVPDVSIVAIPMGIIGGRLYHLITSPDAYFGSHGHPIDAFKVWQGGLGIWGAISLGTLAAWWQFNRLKKNGREGMLTFPIFADSLAPGILLAQAIGRIGNWFNAELFGRPTSLPWGLEIPPESRPSGYENYITFHPTFLYESLWCIFVACLIFAFEKNFRQGQGFLFYIGAYCVGRFFIEMVRIDQAHTIFSVRINVLVSACVALLAFILFFRVQDRR